MMEFDIIPGASREVERSKQVPAYIFFSLPTLPFPKQKVRIMQKVRIIGKKFVIVLDRRGSNFYDVSTATLSLTRFGRIDALRCTNFDRLVETVSSEEIYEAFQLAGEHIIAENFPPGAIDISTGASPLTKVPIMYNHMAAHTERWTEPVHELDDIFFRICGIQVDEKVSIETEKLNIVFDPHDTEPGHYLESEKECFNRSRLDLNSFGYCSESFETENHVSQLRESVSDQEIEAAFQALALKLIEASESQIANGKRKAPPPTVKVWSRSMVNEVHLAKRLKESTLDSE